MRGDFAFCPKTGARLSEERYYRADGPPLRVPVADEYVPAEAIDGELTAGAVCSSHRALLTHFRRTHGFYRSPDDDLYRTVALRLRELKRAASGLHASDMVVWLALYDHLNESGVDADWMLGHVEFRCPHCHGRLKYRQSEPETIHAECATDCTDDHAERLAEIERLATELARNVFGAGSAAAKPRDRTTASESVVGSLG